MSDASRQRRLSVQNRLEELRARHGSDIEALEMPAWLDHLPTPQERQERQQVGRSAAALPRGTAIVPPPGPAVFEDLSV